MPPFLPSRVIRLVIVAGAGLLICLLLLLRRSDGIVSVPLASIISTSGQGELQATTSAYRMVDGKKEYVVPTGEALQRFFETTKGQSASNEFLVDAPDDVSAINVSSAVFAGYRSANYPATLNQPNPPRGKYWLVVFLGTAGSSPVRWIVDDVRTSYPRIRFSYHIDPIRESTADIHYYYYWVPLGALKDGVYNLDLYETNLKTVTLMRRVEIKTTRRKR